MARKADYGNTRKYSNRRSFDGQPVPAGMVLVPFLLDLYDLKRKDYVDDNLTTMHLGEFRYRIGFMPIKEECFAGYMKDFWAEINEDIKLRREGRCVIGTNPDGSDKLCPNTRRCGDCPLKGLLERRNPKRIEILSLDYEFENEGFDIADDRCPSVENQVLEKVCPAPTYKEKKAEVLAHFEKKDPREAEIIRLEIEGKSIDEMCVAIKLKSSRGREVINAANDALCDHIKMPHMKTRHRK